MVNECDDSKDRQGHSHDRLAGIAEVVLDAHINRCIVHIVLYTVSIDKLESPGILLGELEVRTHVDSPAVYRVTQIARWCLIQILPADLPEYGRSFDVAPLSCQAAFHGEIR